MSPVEEVLKVADRFRELQTDEAASRIDYLLAMLKGGTVADRRAIFLMVSGVALAASHRLQLKPAVDHRQGRLRLVSDHDPVMSTQDIAAMLSRPRRKN